MASLPWRAPRPAALSPGLSFARDLRRNLDGADNVYRSINRTIDAFIAEHHLGSGRFSGVGRDAAHVVNVIAERIASDVEAPTLPGALLRERRAP